MSGIITVAPAIRRLSAEAYNIGREVQTEHAAILRMLALLERHRIPADSPAGEFLADSCGQGMRARLDAEDCGPWPN